MALIYINENRERLKIFKGRAGLELHVPAHAHREVVRPVLRIL